MSIKFKVRHDKKLKDVAEVTYECACGCHPNARYTKGSTESGHEHCCCGIVHFAGADAASQLRVYLDERRTQGIDAPDLQYEVEHVTVNAPWGERLSVAYASPKQG